MEFDIRGNLKPYNVIHTDWLTFEKEFVDTFPKSETRQRIFETFSSYLDKLTSIIGHGFYVWIDGSFVTRKLNPGDIDFVAFVDAKTYLNHEPEIDLLRAYHLKNKTGIDDYFVRRFPEDHADHILYFLDSARWHFTFTTSRSRMSKGFIQLNF